MKTRKRLLTAAALAVLALAATAAIASASVWKDGGTNVSTAIEMKFTGAEFYETTETNKGSVQCEEKFTLKTSGGSTATIPLLGFEIVKTGCAKTGVFTTCELTGAEARGLPWTVDVNTSDLTITNMHIRLTFKTGCAITELDKTFNSTVTLTTPEKIEIAETLGTATNYKQFGSFKPATVTYGIG
jgi:hypothetical protein